MSPERLRSGGATDGFLIGSERHSEWPLPFPNLASPLQRKRRGPQTKGGKVIRKYICASAVAVVCGGAICTAQAGAAGQAQPPQQPQPTMQSSTSQAPITLQGCVYKEQDVPGRAPNVAERAGVLEDYILADVKSQAGASSSTPGAAGTSGITAGSMYKLELVADEKLRAMVGKRVEVTGKIDAEAGDKAATPSTPSTTKTDRAIGRDRVDLPEFEVASIKEVTGNCPAKPGAR